MPEFTLIDLAYELDLTSRYQNLRHLPGFVLLQSTDTQRGRYDIVTAYPYKRVNEVSKDVFEALDLQRLPHDLNLDLPFQGGAIGYLSYDLATTLFSTPHQQTVCKLPSLHIGWYDWAIITDHQRKKVSLFAANNCQETGDYLKEIQKLWALTDSCFFQLKTLFSPLIKQEDYVLAIDAIQAAIRAGRCYQVNYTQLFQANYYGDPWAIYKQLSLKNPVPFAAFMSYAQGQVLSFSPERFITYEQGHVLTSPIKGSSARSADKHQDQQLQQALYNCEKNRAENVMIVDLMRNDLAKIAFAGSVVVDSLWAIESYPAVHHLVSHIKAKTNASASRTLQACFPSGSVTGAPKLESMRIIAELEPYARSVYCGTIFYYSHHGRLDSSVAIRTMLVEEERLILSAGGGIVNDSEADSEYLECLTKITAIVKGLE